MPREVPRRMQCGNNTKQIVLALQNYHDTYQVFPPAYFTDQAGKPTHSWRVLILPFMEEKPLYDRYRFDEPWDGPNNRKLHGEIVRAYQCPSDTNPNRWETSYLAVIGKDYFFTGPTSRTMAEVTDGTAYTLAVVEVKHSGIHWMEPRDLHELQISPGINNPHGQGPCSCHANGAMGGYVDGHVELLINSLSPKTIRALLTVSGGEIIQYN